MNSPATESLPLGKLAAALRKVTETLVREVAVPTETAPDWSDFEWRIAQAAAVMQGISALLDRSLRWRCPLGWQEFLKSQRMHIAGRQLKIQTLLADIDSHARQRGVALVALKGAALHANGIYQPGERPMADIDLLAQATDAEAVAQLLERCGYENTFSSWRDRLFEPRIRVPAAAFGEHLDNPIKIELHSRIRERLPVEDTEITAFIFPQAAAPGVHGYRSRAALMMHLLLHAAGNMRARALRMIQLHDIAKLAEGFSADDWEELLAARLQGRALWWAVPPLILTTHYYEGAVPRPVVARLEKECSWLLGRIARRQLISDVSWSNIRIQALPGIEWSQSAREALVYIYRRVLPDREARSELQRFSTYHAGGSQVPWYGISQAARILRWIFSRPPRVQTLLSVRAALARADQSPNSIAARNNL